MSATLWFTSIFRSMTRYRSASSWPVAATWCTGWVPSLSAAVGDACNTPKSVSTHGQNYADDRMSYNFMTRNCLILPGASLQASWPQICIRSWQHPWKEWLHSCQCCLACSHIWEKVSKCEVSHKMWWLHIRILKQSLWRAGLGILFPMNAVNLPL